MGDKVNEYVQALKNMSHGTGDVEQQKAPFREIAKEISLIAGDSCPKLTQAINEALDTDNAEDFKTAIKKVSDALKEGQIEGKNFGQILKLLGQGDYVNKMDKSYKGLNQTIKDLIAKQNVLNQRVKEFNPTHVVSGLEKVTQAAAGLGQVVMLATSVRSVFQAWNNDDLSFGEKLTTTFMSISMLVPSAIGALKSFNTALASGNVTLLGQIALRKSYSNLLSNETTKEMINVTAKKLSNETVKDGIKLDEEALLIEIQKELVEKGIADNNTKEAMSLGILNMAKHKDVGTTWQQTVASSKLTVARIIENAATQKLTVTLGALAIKAIPFIAIAAALGVAIHAISKAMKEAVENSPETQLERASNAAKTAAENYKEAQSAYESLQTTITDSKDVEATLQKMTRGSAEWKAELLQANIQAQELINKFNLLKGIDYNISDGLITFTNEGYNKMTETSFAELSRASANATNTKIIEQQKDFNVKQQQVYDDTSYKYIIKDTSSKAQFEDKIASKDNDFESIGEFFKLLGGTLLESYESYLGYGDGASEFTGLTTDQVDHIVSGLQSGQNFDDIVAEMDLSPSALSIAQDHQAAMERLAQSQIQLANAEQILTSQLIEVVNGDDDDFQNSKDKHWLSDIGSVDVETTKTNKDAAQNTLNNLTTDEQKWDEIFRTLYGENYSDKYKVEDIEDDGKATVYTKNEDGGWDKISDSTNMEVLDDYIKQYLNYKGAERSSEDFESYQNDLDNARANFEGFTDNQDIIDLLAVNAVKNEKQGLNPEDLDLTGLDISKLFADGFDATALRDKVSVETFNALMDMIADYVSNDSENADKYYETNEDGTFKTDSEGNFVEKSAKEYNAVNQEQMTDEIESVLFEGMSADEIAETTEEIESLTDTIQDLAKEGDKVSKTLKDDEKAAKALATAAKQTEKGIEKLSKNFEDWKEAIKSKDIVKSTKAMDDMKEALADVMNISDELNEMGMTLGDHFGDYLVENMDTVKKAANGDRDAILELQEVAAQDMLIQLGYDPNNDAELFQSVSNTMDMIRSKLNDGSLKIGRVDDTELINSLEGIINACATTVPQAEAILARMGFDAEVTSEPSTEEATTWIPATYRPVTQPVGGDENPGATFTYMEKVDSGRWETTPNTKTVNALKIKTANYVGGGNIAGAVGGTGGGGSGGGGGGGGGGGSAPKPAKKIKKTKKVDVVDRYKEITDSLDKNTKALEKAGKKADYLYGPGRIKWLKESNELIKQQNNLLKQQIDEAKTNLDIDQNALDLAAQDLGIKFSYDEDGYIKNYTTEMEKVFAELAAAENTINGFKTQDEQDKYREETLQPLEDKIDALKEAQAQYEETMQLIDELNQQQEDNLRQLENNKSAMITHVIELKVKVDDEDLSHLDFLISRLEAREFRTAKLLSEMQDYLGIYQNQADTAKYGMDKYLTEWLTPKEKSLFYKGRADEIDWASKENLPDDFWDKIIEYANDYREATQSAFELRTEMYDKLGSAFSDLTSEIDNTISKFDHYSQVMDSYTNIIDLSGQKNLFSKEDLKDFNQLKVSSANAKLESSKDRKESYATYAADRKSEYEDDLQRRKDIKKELETAEGESKKQLQGELEAIEQQIKLSKQAWQDAEEAALTANEEFLASWEEALQASRDAFLANVQLELDALEEKMAGTYGSIENMQQDFDRNAEINDRYLEDYERIYELSKMTRDLDKKIDETSNIKAKKELAKLQEEILFYQEEGRKMSDYDLEYLQKKYDLRVAEIAMEEAQNAKTQVRLTRDSEGNYSYTYTADEDSMAQAQQTYEDKLYELTNLSNEYIEEQTGQLIQTQQEYLNALAEIHQKAAEGQYKTTEDYQKALDECTAYYVGKMNYHGGEIDKATMNNAIIYKSDYSNYERYVGDKLTESQKLVNKTDAQILENQKLMTVLTVEKQAALDEVHLAFARGLIKNETEYTKQIDKIEKDYSSRLDIQQGKIDGLIKDRDDMYAKDYGSYSDAAIKKEAAEKNFVTNIKDKWLPQLEDTQSTGQGYVKSFTDAIAGPGGYLESVKNEYNKLNTNIDSNMTSAGTSTKNFAADVKKDLLIGEDSVKRSINNTSTEVDKLIKKLTGENGLTKTAEGLHTWALDVNSDIGILIKNYKDLQKAVQNAQTALRDQSEQELDEGDGNDGTPPTDPTPPEVKPIIKGAKVKASKNALIYDYQADTTGETQYFKSDPKYVVLQVQGNRVQVRHHSKTKVAGWFNISDLKAYDTGGYTGRWGSEGKLAMLHEKELILNKSDTENMLKIIEMVRDLSAALDSQAYYSSLAQLKASQLNAMQNHLENFEQTVTIHAEFPAASSAAEIEAALSNLVNNASQYANRKY